MKKFLILISCIAYASASAGSFRTLLQTTMQSKQTKVAATLAFGVGLDYLHKTYSQKSPQPTWKNNPCTIGTIANCATAGTIFTMIGAGFLNEHIFHDENVLLQKIESAAQRRTKCCFLVVAGVLAAQVCRYVVKTHKTF